MSLSSLIPCLQPSGPNLLHAVRITNCTGNFHNCRTLMLYFCCFRECLPAFPLTLGFCRFSCAPTMSAFGFPYFVILIRSPCTARSTSSSNLFFASVNPTVSMTLCSCNSNTTSGWTAYLQYSQEKD